jgi:hypothetical protein
MLAEALHQIPEEPGSPQPLKSGSLNRESVPPGRAVKPDEFVAPVFGLIQ